MPSNTTLVAVASVAGAVLVVAVLVYLLLRGESGPAGGGGGNGGGNTVLKDGLYYIHGLGQGGRWKNLAGAIGACLAYKGGRLATTAEVAACTSPSTRKPSSAAYVADGRVLQPSQGAVGPRPLFASQHVGAMATPNTLYMFVDAGAQAPAIRTVYAQFHDATTAIRAGYISVSSNALPSSLEPVTTDIQARAIAFYQVPAGTAGEFVLVVKNGPMRGCIAYAPLLAPDSGVYTLMLAATPALLPGEAATLLKPDAKTGAVTMPETKSPLPLSINSLTPTNVFAPPSAPKTNTASKIVFTAVTV